MINRKTGLNFKNMKNRKKLAIGNDEKSINKNSRCLKLTITNKAN
jgi:hypothetical protein